MRKGICYNVKIIYMGYHYRKEDEKYLLEMCKGVISAAHYKFQNAMISGLRKYTVKMQLITSLPVGSFPVFSSKLFIKSKLHGNDYFEIGFINLPIVKNWSRFLRSYIQLRNLLKTNDSSEKTTVIIYDLSIPFLWSVYKARKQGFTFNVVLVVPDLPGKLGIEYTGQKKLVSFIKKKQEKNLNLYIQNVDGFILLTEAMKDALSIQNKAYMIMEGMTTIEKDTYVIQFHKKKILLYAGELSNNVNLQDLIETIINRSKLEIELWICGKGDLEEYIKTKAAKDSRIKYFGYLSMYKMRELEAQVDIYINPRRSVHEYTKYSFPSKNLEYLKTGKPVIAYKLAGIPNEYDSYLFYPKDESNIALGEKIQEVCSLICEELQRIKCEQIEFVTRYKSKEAQCSRIFDFLEGI